MKKILLLDICGTITSKNTTIDFINYIGFKPSHIKLLIGKIMWKFFHNDILRRWYLLELKGIDKKELETLAEKYIAQLKFDKEILKYISYLQENGYDIYIISATLDCIANEISKIVNSKRIYSSELSFKNNVCCGSLKKDLLDKKLIELYKDNIFYNNITLTISDNEGDLDVMKHSNYSIAVVRNKKKQSFWKKKNILSLRRY
ncbi:MAG: haloacid dehalogenase-like hydrolase [Proteus mirabilis]